MILGQNFLPIAGATPTCVNMALSMAAFLGFTDMALFGADCGIRPGSDDHAKDTVYQDIGVFQKEGDTNDRYPVEVEGNFGGIARTNWIYDSCRLMLAEVIELRRLNVANASDGAFIPGAVPRVPEAVLPSSAALDRAAVIEAIKRSLDEITPAKLFAETDLANVARPGGCSVCRSRFYAGRVRAGRARFRDRLPRDDLILGRFRARATARRIRSSLAP